MKVNGVEVDKVTKEVADEVNDKVAYMMIDEVADKVANMVAGMVVDKVADKVMLVEKAADEVAGEVTD